MPLEAPLAPATERAAELDARFARHGATAILRHALSDAQVGRIALVSSFGAEAAVLLHMVSVIDRTTPVIFLDTEMLFPETLAYQQALTDLLGLADVRLERPDRAQVFATDPDATLHRTQPDACCALRKAAPLARALAPFDAWITGRKRFQGGRRAGLPAFEADAAGRIKVNPLARWEPGDVTDYMVNNRLPRHPLVAHGYASLGCAPCTTPVAAGEDPRAGRWRGRGKTECGIHFDGGRVVRGTAGGAVHER
ncbi:phosphoadenylyl-sulfate reductase [Rhodobacteraceae bacterium CCMM004]|nr:phosphoadenylyl-sulfate reductase [Rhodobacteraceae bacterium CCMM004]